MKLLEMPADLIRQAIDSERAAENLILDRDLLYLTPLHRAEVGCAAQLPAPAARPAALERHRRGQALPWVEAQTRLTLSAPARGRGHLLRHKVTLITGVPASARPPCSIACCELSGPNGYQCY